MAKETMIERMCRAMCRDQYPGANEDGWIVSAKCYRWELFRSQAKVALEALREPTEEMVAAGADYRPVHPEVRSKECWIAMIDVVLEEF